MQKKILLSLALISVTLFGIGQNAWINELHYDNVSSDVGEFVEIVIENPGSYTLSDFEVYLYNGSSSSGATYSNESMNNFTVGTTVGNFTIYTWYPSSIQNGAPDGLALVYQGTVISNQFLSYEGTFTATDGPANGLTSTDIGVAETSSTPIGESLQLSGSGTSYPDFVWNAPAAETPGNENNGQTLGGALDPEPTNYPTNFTATATGLVIDNSWTDATGAQLPAAYLVLISDQNNIVAPTDGVFQADDTDISDGSGALNISFGDEASTFYRLSSVTTYYCEIYPYTNAGANVDYKTDGSAPEASATTAFAINTVDFETGDFGTWSTYNVASDKDWTVLDYGGALGTTYFAEMNGFNENVPSNDWLISPALNLDSYSSEMMVFYTSWKYGNDETELTLKYSTDYTGGDPTQATWTDLTFTVAASADTWASSGSVDLSGIAGTDVYIAFQYLSSGSPRRWDVDEIEITGDILTAEARIVGSMNGWNTTDPDYVMAPNANGLYELVKSLGAGDHEYKVLEGDDWSAPNYPSTNQHVILTGTEDVTWKANITADLVTHTLPVMAGNFFSQIGGNDWDPTELMGEMTDPDGDDIFTLELTIPAGNWEGKVTLNNNWDQSTGGNVGFVTDGVNSTTFTYDFPNNITTISGPPPPTNLFTFMVEDTASMNYDGFFLKGSWDAGGQYDPSWGGGIEHSPFYDDGTHGDVIADDHIWTCQQDLVVDGGTNTWEWGVNDSESNWIAGNWQFTNPDQTPQTLIWTIPAVDDIVINEIMYNSPGTDEEWIELYNNTDQTINLENWNVCDEDASHTHIYIPAGYSVAPGEYFTISIATGGAFPFTPDFDGTGNFALNNGGDAVRIWNNNGLLVDIVTYDDSSPWPTEPDGNGPTLSLIQPDLDNALAESWRPSQQDLGTPGAINFPIAITAPNGGETIETNSTYDITWDVEDWDGNIVIELIRDGYDPIMLVSNLPVSTETFAWNVFSTIDPASDYKILITNIDDDTPYDESDDYFTIVEGYVIPEIVITEIMYNPPESGNDSLEFIEIYNNGAETVNLDGFMFTAGVDYTFPNVDLLPDSYLLVSINSDAMLSTFGVDAYQWTGGALSNSGELIELSDSFANVIDSLTYDDSLPWDTLADGHGPSLTLCNPDADNSIAENWTHSVNFAAINTEGDSIYATPGFACQVELLPAFEADNTTVSLNESVMFTDLSIGDPIEWIWTFEGGTPDTYNGQTPPEIFYNELGTWDVTLYISDGTNNAEVTYPDYIEVVYFAPPTNLEATVGPYDDVQLTWNAPVTNGFEDDFESYDDFVLEFLPWTNVDVDLSTTYGMTGVDWPNAFAEQAFIIFNPSQTTPPVDDIIPHSGDKIAACFAATSPPNDDWLITPLVGIGTGYKVSFWAKSYTADYGLERFRVGVSTSGVSPSDFTIISPGDYEEAPVDDWTEFFYDLAPYAGQSIYLAIQCVSNDAFILLVDDFYVGASKSAIVYNAVNPIVGKAMKSINYIATPAAIPNQNSQIDRNVINDLLGYNVYRDDIQINATIVEVTEYNDPEPTIGSHDYYVTAVYDDGESDPSNVVSVVVTDINEVVANHISIYPNPTDGVFHIEFENNITAEIVIMDLTGKEVYRNVTNRSININVSDLQKGMYLIRIIDLKSNVQIIEKLIVR
ncbi:MAG: hypothetical protein CL661_11060 [Bacteroidetes bacterium]|nr:hypothetical protein [Bacteroidota bacterium]